MASFGGIPWETLSSVSRVTLAHECMGAPWCLVTGFCHWEGSCPLPHTPRPGHLSSEPATLPSPLAQQQLPTAPLLSWGSELGQHRRGVGRGGVQGGRRKEDGAGMGPACPDSTGMSLWLIPPSPARSGSSTRMELLVWVFFYKGGNTWQFIFLITAALCSFSSKRNHFLY